MRNLKRALSLTLASVMLLGMMVVGSSAAKSYPDVTEEENIEAIEVLQSVGVMEGDNNGNFNPDDYVTREQMAVIMSKLLNLDYNYYQGTNPFSDVPAWAAPYVAACAANGITSGIGGGMYGAGQNVNAVQAALMMSKALGYFQYQQDFGEDYILATVKQATEIGLFNQIDSKAEQALTRNEVAQMALNALQADLVRFTGDPGVTYTGSNGESWVGGYKAEYTPRTSPDPKYNQLIDNKHSSDIDYSGQYYCQLGEELYNGTLVKRYDSDIFERPSYTWTYKTELIGTYVAKDKFLTSYTKAVEARTLYDLLNNITIRDYDLEVYVDGHKAGEADVSEYGAGYTNANEIREFDNLTRSNNKSVGITAKGVLTEVYLDRDNEIITIVSIHTWLAQGSSDYSESREAATMKVFSYTVAGASKTVNKDDVPEAVDVKNGSFYLVRMSDKDTAALEVVDIEEPQILTESTITKFSNGTKTDGTDVYPTKLTTGGNEYEKSDRAKYDEETLNSYNADLLANNTYNVYLDKYGYFIGIDLFEGEKQYVFITGYDMKYSNLSYKTAEASAIFLDGTMDNVTVNVKDTNKNIVKMVYNTNSSGTVTGPKDANAGAYYKEWQTNASQGVYLLNRWYTYTKNEAGVYTLKPCVDKNGAAMMLAAKSDNSQTAGKPDVLKLNASKLRLDSVTNTEGLLVGEDMKYVNTGLSSYRAYGEDESVFITVDTEKVSAIAGGDGNLKVTRGITDINGVLTGVQDVNMLTDYTDRVKGTYYNNGVGGTGTPTDGTIAKGDKHDDFWSGANGTDDAEAGTVTECFLGENAYAVFDKNNFIIGAVILGEAEGNNATKAYILDPVKYERYENGTYYWQFEAVINGEKVTQEAESKFESTIDEMRDHQYEIVELRYNGAGDVVTEVRFFDRADTAAGTKTDKIYGNPFGEIKNHQVDTDQESIYDVVLTSNTATGTGTTAHNGVQYYDFDYVTRPSNYGNEHNWLVGDAASSAAHIEERFTKTEQGVLNLQGRTLWVLGGRTTASAAADYGIDFTRDAKAVVIQPEGTPTRNEMKTRTYDSVQAAIDSLSDGIDPTTTVKEFRGIITAPLNAQGVAEWVVFYSDTLLDTRSSSNVPLSDKAMVEAAEAIVELMDGTVIAGPTFLTAKSNAIDAIETAINNEKVTVDVERVSFTAPTTSGTGTLILNVTLSKGNVSKTVGDLTFTLRQIPAKVVSSLQIVTNPDKVSGWKVGDTFTENVDAASAQIQVNYSDGTNETLSQSDFAGKSLTVSCNIDSVSTYSSASDAVKITFTMGGKSVVQNCTMVKRTTPSASVGAASGNLTAGTAGSVTATLTLPDGAKNVVATCATTGITVGVSGTTVTVSGDTTTTAGSASVSISWDYEDDTNGTPLNLSVTIS